jgi:hypothetical protein
VNWHCLSYCHSDNWTETRPACTIGEVKETGCHGKIAHQKPAFAIAETASLSSLSGPNFPIPFTIERSAMSIQRLLMTCLLAIAMLPAHAFERPFPKNAKRGTMEVGAYPAVAINDKTRRLSAGARIWNTKNMIQQPASLVGQEMVVNYTEDKQGNIDRVWILTAEEAKQPPPKPTPAPELPTTN